MKEIYLHTYDMPRSCVDCDFRQDTYCKAQRIDDGEYVSCNQSKSGMKDGKPITCPLRCIKSGELFDCEDVRKETAREILQPLYNRTKNHYGNRTTLTSNDVKEFAKKYGIDLEEQ